MIVLHRLAKRLQNLVEQSYEPGFMNSPVKVASFRGAADSLASVTLGMVEDENPTTRALAEIRCFVIGHRLPDPEHWFNGKTHCIRCGAYHFKGERWKQR